MSAYSASVLADGAWFYWRLGESAGTTAVDAAGTLGGTYIGAVSLAQAGALSLSGDTDTAVEFGPSATYVNVAANSLHQGLSNWTLEAWAYRTGTLGADAALATHAFISTLPCVLRVLADGTPGAIFYNGGFWGCNDTSILPLNTWAHVVGTWDGTTVRIYRNGVQTNTNVPGAGHWAAAPGAATFRIGHRWDGTQGFPGRIDEVALYATALTPSQVLAHYTTATTPPAAPSILSGTDWAAVLTTL